MKTNAQKTNRKIWIGAMIGIALVALFFQPRTVSGQQWTGPDGSGNIWNANTGNVGVGTNTPDRLFTIQGAVPSFSTPLSVFRTTGAVNGFGLMLDATGAGNNNLGFARSGAPKASFAWDNSRNFLGFINYLYSSYDFSFRLNSDGSLTYHDSTSSAERFRITAAGNVGIGTPTPAYKLDLLGGYFHTTYNTQSHPASSIYGGLAIGWNRHAGNAEVNFYNVYDNAGISYQFSQKTGASTAADLLTILGNGNVGIGTASPQRTLDAGTSGQITFGDDGYTSSGSPGVYWVSGNGYGLYKTPGTWTAPNYQQLEMIFATGIVIDGGSAYGKSGTVLQPNGGNVGIGTSPASGNKLDVNGNTNVTGNLTASGTINAAGGVNLNGTSITSSAGNIGIGATSPQSKLSVNTSTQSPGSMLEINNRGDLAAGSWSAIRFGLDSNSYPNQYAKGGIIYESRDGYNRGKLHLVVNTAANTANMSLSDALLTVDGTTGNVGIGLTTPTSKLDVAGNVNATGTITATGLNINGSPVTSSQWTTSGSNISYTVANGNVGIGGTPTTKLHVFGDGKVTGNLTVDGNIAAKYQDMAEWVPSSEQLPTGTVVVLDSTKSNQVISSTQAYDTRVAGVISEQPGIALGESGAGKVLVATTGRVQVQVDASKSPIHIGDLLVTSDVPGVAMKSEPVNLGGVQLHRPGTLIGKALEPLEKGSGKILVLLSLQ
jgi:hypothetical protein